jgi:hypothetical protein
MKKKQPRTPKPKPRNAGTMTESGFWAFIRSSLRQRSRFWKPILLAKELVKRNYEGSNKKQKYEYQCNHCKKWYAAKNVNVDHIYPAGELNCSDDLPGFIERLFCEAQSLQVLCLDCHDVKTQNERQNKSK